MGNKKLLEILRLGILEIRILSASGDDNKKRINQLSNILHNIPSALSDDVNFDYDFLNKELENYKDIYTDTLFNTKETK